MTVRSSIRGAIRSSIRSSIGKLSNLFKGIYAFYPLATNGDNTIVLTTEINTRLSPKNYDNDSGNLVTVGEYETAFTGSAALYEPSATNKLGMTRDITSAIWFGGEVGVNGMDDAILIDYSLTVNPVRLYQVDTVYTGDVCLQVYVKAYAGHSGMYNLSVQESANVNNSLKFIDDSEWVLCKVTGAFSSASSISSYLARDDRGNTLEKFYIKWPNLVYGNTVASSPIINDTVADATRDSDKPTVPSSDAWVLPDCQLASRWINSKYFTFTASGEGNPPTDGTLRNKCTTDDVGAILIAENGAMVEVTTSNYGNDWIVAILKGTEQEVREGFEYPAKFSVHWEHSVYGDNNDLAGVKALRESVGDFGNKSATRYNLSSAASGVTVAGKSITSNGTYTNGEVLVNATIAGANEKSGGKSVATFNAVINSGSITILGQPVVSGFNRITLDTADRDVGDIVGAIRSATTGAVDIVVTDVEVGSYYWYDFPTANLTTSFKFTPLALIGEGDSIVNVVDTANNQGYFVSIPDSDYDSFEVTVYEGVNTMSVTVPIAGGININQEYACSVSITDSDVYLSIDESTVSDTNTVTFVAGHWDAKIPLAGSSEAVYACKITDLKCADYVTAETANNLTYNGNNLIFNGNNVVYEG